MSLHDYLQMYQDLMLRLASMAGGDRAAHMSAGMIIWLVSARLMRWPLRDIRPLLVVIAIELLNEIVDRIYAGSWRWNDTSRDIVSTIIWPAILYLVFKHGKYLRA